MRLASDPITITVDGVSATLRPSLRAAYHLQRRHGFPALMTGIAESNLSVVADLIAYGSDDTTTLPALLREIDKRGIVSLDILKPSLFAFIGELIGVDDRYDAPASTKQISFDEYFTSLYEIGAGWLGWTPETTWTATPGEIIAAQRGVIAFRKALHGTGEDKPEYDPREEVSEDQVSAGIAQLKASAARGRQ
ncbi:hypothetical protein ABFT80_00825 [Mesorhizobium sp. SB112]|uniref:hypothetical protein n=1 Tax=Mesorhizobium sp. SB112 TaxID=3151853 RepID=UPI003265D8C0